MGRKRRRICSVGWAASMASTERAELMMARERGDNVAAAAAVAAEANDH